MQVQPLYSNNNISQYNLQQNNGCSFTKPQFKGNDQYLQNKEKENKSLKIGLSCIGVIGTVLAIVNRKKIGEAYRKYFGKNNIVYTDKEVIKKGSQSLAEKIMGNQNSAQLEQGAKEAAAKASEISQKRQEFPELVAGREDRSAIIAKNKLKETSEKIDLEYYKDDFRAFVTVPVDRLNNLRRSTNSRLKEMFDLDRNNFQIHEGIMIHGNNDAEKKKLLDHFVAEAKKHEIDVIHIPAGDTDPVFFSQQIPKLFSEAKAKFINDKKTTMFVMEDMDKMLNIKDPQISAQNSWVRAAINEYTHKCGNEGVIWISTVKDLSKLDESCYRGGRVRHTIDIDNIGGSSL